MCNKTSSEQDETLMCEEMSLEQEEKLIYKKGGN